MQVLIINYLMSWVQGTRDYFFIKGKGPSAINLI